jgi:DNA excision repair protein ERCC-6
MDQTVKNEEDGASGEPSSDKKQQGISTETSNIPGVSDELASMQESSGAADEASRLKELQADVRDQDALERDITRQVYLTPPRAKRVPDDPTGR